MVFALTLAMDDQASFVLVVVVTLFMVPVLFTFFKSFHTFVVRFAVYVYTYGLVSCYRRWIIRFSKMKVHWRTYNHCLFVAYLASVAFGYE